MLYVDFGVGSRQVAGQQDSRIGSRAGQVAGQVSLHIHTYISPSRCSSQIRLGLSQIMYVVAAESRDRAREQVR